MRAPRIVVTLHGIRTHGRWQKEITPFLARHGLIPYHLDFGWFNTLRFFLPWSREKQVQKIRTELRNLVELTACSRLNVIAHSFGTFLMTEALVRENGQLLYDRVVLSGSIVDRSFDWRGQLTERRVSAVRNERTDADWVVVLAAWVSRRMQWMSRLEAGASGREPFVQESPMLLDDFTRGGHSEVHNPLKYEQWARFIAYPMLPPDLCERVRLELQWLRQRAADFFDMDATKVRTNLFACFDGALQIVPGATDNMEHAPEFDLRLEPGHGGTGSAFLGTPSVVVKRGPRWSSGHLPASELAKLHPRLAWIVSMPVLSETRREVVGVINVDGLDDIPDLLEDPASQTCQDAALALHGSMVRKFQGYLDAAFRGDKLASMRIPT